MSETSRWRSLYRWSAFLALPGGLWAAFEMYGLTLRGSQMLFFTIAHTMLPLIIAVWLSVPLGITWLGQSVVAATTPSYRARIAVPLRALLVFIVAICVHAAALSWYGSWSVTSLRVPICLVGLLLTALVVREWWREVRPAAPRPLLQGAKSDA
jgi:hypothetical protein